MAEERWAHQEAKKRELAEVADFMGLYPHCFHCEDVWVRVRVWWGGGCPCVPPCVCHCVLGVN